MSLAVHGVRMSFGGNTILDGVSLDARDGAVTALIGPNGAGKTTLFNVIAGVLTPRAGRVVLDGDDVSRLGVHRRVRAGLGRTFQRLELFGTLTVAENLQVAASRLPRHERRAAVEEMIDRLGLGPVADVRSGGLPTGTGRVVELARALLGRPTTLLLDEPASGQNPEETRRFSGLLHRLADEGLAILLVEHDMDLVMGTAGHIHVLDFGHLIASGPPARIRTDPAVRAAYLGDVVGPTAAVGP